MRPHPLPIASDEALTRSNTLIDFIRQDIAAHQGEITFKRYMEHALYHPQYGYYQSTHCQLGKAGDFITAPLLSPLFAQCIAAQCLGLFRTHPHWGFLELGAGTGDFAADFLTTLAQAGQLPTHYYIYEISKQLRKKQQALLAQRCPDLMPSITWLDALPTQFSGIIFGNEILDAIPVHIFSLNDHQVLERYVTYQQKKLCFKWGLPSTVALTQAVTALQQRYHLSAPYESEINFSLEEMVAALAQSLKEGMLLFFDYGYGERDYYHPSRRLGTLCCYFKQHTHADALLYPGLQDITAHVNFTQVAEIATQHGCELSAYTSQAAFLLANGLQEFVSRAEQQASHAADQVALHNKVKTLTLSTQMGERIQVMALSKNASISINGPKLHDRRQCL